MEANGNGKHSSLLTDGNNYSCKSFMAQSLGQTKELAELYSKISIIR